MDQANQGYYYDAPAFFPLKRKRGRPRKDRSLIPVEAARAPPGFERLNGSIHPHLDPINDTSESIIGQAVTGVIEASFDAGYLLAVKIANSSTTLRGVVFKSGHYAPVTSENDVVPHIQMIARRRIFSSTGSRGRGQGRGRGRRLHSREMNMQLVNYVGNGSPPSSQLVRPAPSSRGLYVSAPSVPPVGARGTVVPVVLQPVNVANGLPMNHSAHSAAMKGKHVQSALPLSAYLPNGSTSQSQSSLQTASGGVRADVISKQGIGQDETMPRKAGDLHFQGEIVSGGQISFQLSENQNGESKLGGGDVADMNEPPLFVEPLQTRFSVHMHGQPASISRPVATSGVGRMSELLQAVQQNMFKDMVPQVGHQTNGAAVAFHEPKSIETKTKENVSVDAMRRSQQGNM